MQKSFCDVITLVLYLAVRGGRCKRQDAEKTESSEMTEIRKDRIDRKISNFCLSLSVYKKRIELHLGICKTDIISEFLLK